MVEMNMSNSTKLSFGAKAGYGVGTIGESIALNVFYIYFLFFLTNAVGMNAGVSGTVAMIVTFVGAFTDLIAGNKTDNSTNPRGRRRPFIIRAAVLLGVATFLMYTDWATIPMSVKPVYFVIVSVIFWLTLSFTDIPYISLGSEITDNPDEKISLRSISNILNYGGMILASSGTLTFVALLSEDGGVGDTGAWSKVGLLFGIITLLTYWVSAAATKGREKLYVPVKEEHGEKQSMLVMYKEILNVKAYRKVLLYTMFAYGGVLLFTSMYIYYLTYNAGATESQSAIVMLVYCFMVMILSTVCGKVKMEKKTVVITGTGICALGLCFLNFVTASVALAYVFFFFVAVIISVYFVQIFAMVYDVCDIYEFKTKHENAGVIVSLFQFSGKFVGGIAMLAVGWILELSNYDATAMVQTEQTLNGIAAGTLLLPGLLMLIGVVVMIKYPVNSRNHAALLNALKARKEGKEYSTESFEELLK